MNDSDFQSLKQFLDSEAFRINHPDFIANDPVQFPRRFERLQDIEVVAFLSAAIAWGKRKMICNNYSIFIDNLFIFHFFNNLHKTIKR